MLGGLKLLVNLFSNNILFNIALNKWCKLSMDSDQLIALLVTDLFFFIKVAQTDEKKKILSPHRKKEPNTWTENSQNS